MSVFLSKMSGKGSRLHLPDTQEFMAMGGMKYSNRQKA